MRTIFAIFERGTPRLLTAALIGLFIAALEQTIIGPAMGAIAGEFSKSELLPWTANLYLLSAMISSALSGALADIRGRRYTLLLSMVIFLLGTTACALSTNMISLIISRGVQGLGAGGLMTMPFVIMADRIPMARRATFAAYISTVFAMAGILGPVAGGFFVSHMGWRAIFWINIPFGLVVLWGCATALTPRARSEGRSLDVLGAILLTLATLPTLALLNDDFFDFSLFPGDLTLMAALLWSLFGVHIFRSKDPLVPVSVLRNRTILASSVGLAACQGANLSLAIYLPLMYQTKYQASPFHSGLALLVFVSGVLLAAYISPRVLKHSPYYKPLMVKASMLGLISSLVFMFALHQSLDVLWILGVTFVVGISIGLLYPIFAIVVQNAEHAFVGPAMGVLAFMRSLGGVIGVSIAGISAVSAGLIVGSGGDENAWHLAIVPTLFMLVGLISHCLLPGRKLEGYGD